MSDLGKAAEEAVTHAARLSLFARQWVDGAAAQDVVQEALVTLLSQRVCPDNAIAWMYTVVRNLAIDVARANGRRRRREQRVAADRGEWFEPAAGSGLDAQAAQAVLQTLPGEMREIVVLRIWGELGFVEIARIARVSVGTAHQRYTDAMVRLRAALDERR